MNDEDTRYLAKEMASVKETNTISIIPSIADGKEDDVLTVGDDVQLSDEEVLRHSRQLIMPEVGMTGQIKLKASRALMIGAGSLGSPLGLYLPAAGVRKIGIVDLTNLQCQALHFTEDRGRSNRLRRDMSHKGATR